MLEPDSRVVLLDQLRPPSGYRLHAAIATTFTLDLTTAVVPPLAFASFEVRGTPDPVAALEAIRSCTDRVDIFCQAGQIVVPRQHSDLMAYLEPMVHPVRRPRPGRLFHPKVWFLHYHADGETDRFRLLCSTRNLTDSHAWDAVVTLDGTAGGKNDPDNGPLATFIRHLPTLAVIDLEPRRVARIDALADAAARVVWELPDNVKDAAFHAFGVPRVNLKPDFSGYRHLVVSPFCNEDGLARLTGTSRGAVTVVSRAETLDQLTPEALAGLTTHILDPLAVLNAPGAQSEDDVDGAAVATGRPELDTLSGLHAKVTVVERNRLAHVFIGSPNATSAAYGGNVEFAVELIGAVKHLGVDTYLGKDAPFAELLQAYTGGEGVVVDADEELLKALRNQLRDLAEVPFTLTVRLAAEQSGHDLHLESEKPIALRPGYELKVELLTRAGIAYHLDAGERADAVFPGVPLADVTPFVVLLVSDVEHSTASNRLELSTVVHASLIDDPPSRLDEVLARQVDTPEKFLRFLALLLGFGDGSSLAAGLGQPNGAGAWHTGAGAGIFEIVANALATNPGSLHDLDRLVERLRSTEAGREVLPDGFDNLWESVKGALAALEEAR